MDNIKDVLNGVIQNLSIRQPEKQSKIDRIWRNISSPKDQQHTSLEKYEDNVLFIIVDTPAWMYHLKMKKTALLDKFKEEIPEIRDMKFKVGKVK